MALNANQKWTVGTGIAVIVCVFIMMMLLRPRTPAAPPADGGVSVTGTAVITPTAVQAAQGTTSPVVPAAPAPEPTPTLAVQQKPDKPVNNQQ